MILKNTLHHKYYQDVPDYLVKQLGDFRQHVPLQMQSIGAHEWTYYDVGNVNAETLLLLHGGGGTAETMFRYIGRFSEHFRVIAPNIPPTIKTIDDATAGLHVLLTQCGVEHSIVVGMSFGAMLAQMYIRRFMQQVVDLVITHSLIPSAHRAEPAAMQKNMMRLYPELLLLWMSRRAYQTHIDESTTPATADEKSFWKAYFEEHYSHVIRKKHLIGRAHLTTDYHRAYEFNSRDLLEWHGNLLIIESEQDHVISSGDRGSLKAMYSRAYIQTLTGYDHLAPLLASDEISTSIVNFLLKDG